MSRSSRHHSDGRPAQGITTVDNTRYRVDATTTFVQWMRAWLDAGAAGITDVFTDRDGPLGAEKVVVLAYRLPENAEVLAELMARSLAELVVHGVLAPAGLDFAFPEPDYAPSSNTGRTTNDRQSQEGDEGLVNSAIEALIKLRRDRASGL